MKFHVQLNFVFEAPEYSYGPRDYEAVAKLEIENFSRDVRYLSEAVAEAEDIHVRVQPLSSAPECVRCKLTLDEHRGADHSFRMT